MSKYNIAAWMDNDFTRDVPFNNPSLQLERNDGSHPINRGDCFAANRLLAKKLEKLNYEIHTQDFYIDRNIRPDLVIFFDIPPSQVLHKINYWKEIKKILILQECAVVRPLNWRNDYLALFDLIFTWNKDYVDNKKFFWFPTIHGYKLSDLPIKKGIGHKNRLVSLISSNKVSTHKLELYSKRKEIIDWFEINAPNDFDLYGYDWEKIVIRKPRLLKIFNKLKIEKRFFNLSLKTYKGEINDKRNILEKYKFCFSLENAININGYITEKIFDCFVSGTIPIYLGSNSIYDFVPKDCFIDMKKFNSLNEIYQFIKSFDDNKYINMQNNISNYLESSVSKQFTDEGYVQNILPKILEFLQNDR